ncbi:Uncharacterised protein [Bacteroides xylanisolvens]|nr:Uncharacterised protein [Bacteroides xylanisolvens]
MSLDFLVPADQSLIPSYQSLVTSHLVPVSIVISGGMHEVIQSDPVFRDAPDRHFYDRAVFRGAWAVQLLAHRCGAVSEYQCALCHRVGAL